ncbi:MAG: sugar ABC transporter permease [Actinobacteria bacterium]|nr:sugar ABC transporter permease [Actinomycetota bacterium]
MTTVDRAETVVQPVARTARRRRPQPSFRGNWWRHLVALAAIVIAVFPIAYVASAAFNADQSLGGASLIPREVTLDNFSELLDPTVDEGSSTSHYLRWLVNSLIVALTTALATVLLGALAAYAFSRFRFRGRRFGLLSLLLIQMFPQLLALVAIYLILLNTGEVFPALGLDTRTGLILVYLGGVMGVNTWLMKGFFDSIPMELDESARVDGATPAQIFWGVVLPLALPILAVIGILSFVGTFNEFVLASTLLQSNENFTLPLGLRGYIDKQYAEHWGPFAAGVLLAGVPIMIIFLALQRFIVSGLTGGSVKG